MKYTILRTRKPRLYCTIDRPDFRFDPPEDEYRRMMFANVIESCEEEIDHTPPERVPQMDNSPHPYHNLYLCYYNALQGQTMVEQFAFGYLLTGDQRYADQAVRCAVVEALDEGVLDQGRFENYLKMKRELLYIERKQDTGAEVAERTKWKKIHKMARDFNKRDRR